MKQELNDSGIIVYDMHDDYSRGRSSATKKAKEHTEQTRSDTIENSDTEQMKRLGGFSGKVYDKLTYRTITGAQVIIATDLSVKTDERGNFHVTGVRPGNYRLRVSEEGYIVQSRKGTAVAGEVTTINAFHLVPDCLAAERPDEVEWDDTEDEVFTEFALEVVSTPEATERATQAPQQKDDAPVVSAAPAAPPDEPDTGAGPCADTAALSDVDIDFDMYEALLLTDSDSGAAEEIIFELIEQSRIMDNNASITDHENVSIIEQSADTDPSSDTVEALEISLPRIQEQVTEESPELPSTTAPDAVGVQINAASPPLLETEKVLMPETVHESPSDDYSKEHASNERSSAESSRGVGKLWKSLRKKIADGLVLPSADTTVQDEHMGPAAQHTPDEQPDLEPSTGLVNELPNITIGAQPGIDTLILPENCDTPIDIGSFCNPAFDVTSEQLPLITDRLHEPINLRDCVLLKAAPVIEQIASSVSSICSPTQKVSISEYTPAVCFTGSDVPCPPTIANAPEYEKTFGRGCFGTGPGIQIDALSSKTPEWLGETVFKIVPNLNIEDIPSLPCFTAEPASEAAKALAEKDTAGKPLKLVREPVRVRRRPEQPSGEDISREEHLLSDARTEVEHENIDSKAQSKLLWWTKRGRRTADQTQEAETTHAETSAAGNTSELQEQTAADRESEARLPDSIIKTEVFPEKTETVHSMDTELIAETATGFQQTAPCSINEDAAADISENDRDFVSEQEKEAMSPDEFEGVLAAGCTGTLKVFPNPAFKGLPITVTYQVKNHECEDTDNTRVQITIIDPDDERVLETFESQITCKKGSFNIGGFTVSTATYEAHTYHICMDIATIDGTARNPVTHIPLNIKSIY